MGTAGGGEELRGGVGSAELRDGGGGGGGGGERVLSRAGSTGDFPVASVSSGGLPTFVPLATIFEAVAFICGTSEAPDGGAGGEDSDVSVALAFEGTLGVFVLGLGFGVALGAAFGGAFGGAFGAALGAAFDATFLDAFVDALGFAGAFAFFAGGVMSSSSSESLLNSTKSSFEASKARPV